MIQGCLLQNRWNRKAALHETKRTFTAARFIFCTTYLQIPRTMQESLPFLFFFLKDLPDLPEGHNDATVLLWLFFRTHKGHLSEWYWVAWFETESQFLLCPIRRERKNLWIYSVNIPEFSKPEETAGSYSCQLCHRPWRFFCPNLNPTSLELVCLFRRKPDFI